MRYGPATKTVAAFIRHVENLKPCTLSRVSALGESLHRDARWDATMAAARATQALWRPWNDVAFAAGEAAATAAGPAADAARYAVCEILGERVLREEGRPFSFLTCFGFNEPSEILRPATELDRNATVALA